MHSLGFAESMGPVRSSLDVWALPTDLRHLQQRQLTSSNNINNSNNDATTIDRCFSSSRHNNSSTRNGIDSVAYHSRGSTIATACRRHQQW